MPSPVISAVHDIGEWRGRTARRGSIAPPSRPRSSGRGDSRSARRTPQRVSGRPMRRSRATLRASTFIPRDPLEDPPAPVPQPRQDVVARAGPLDLDHVGTSRSASDREQRDAARPFSHRGRGSPRAAGRVYPTVEQRRGGTHGRDTTMYAPSSSSRVSGPRDLDDQERPQGPLPSRLDVDDGTMIMNAADRAAARRRTSRR